MKSCLCSKSVVIVATGNTESIWAMRFHRILQICSRNLSLRPLRGASGYWAPSLAGTGLRHSPALLLGTTLAGVVGVPDRYWFWAPPHLTTVKMVNILGPVLILGTLILQLWRWSKFQESTIVSLEAYSRMSNLWRWLWLSLRQIYECNILFVIYV